MMTSIEEQKRLLKFVEEAATDFNEHPDHTTYGSTEAGGLLAIRWGMGGDCVLVLKVDENFEPMNYQQACVPALDAGKLLGLVQKLLAVPSHEQGAWADALGNLQAFCRRYEEKTGGS